MNKDVLVSIFRLNEAEALLAVEPLHGSRDHANHSFKNIRFNRADGVAR
jgi:hypothetical protein